MSNIVQNYSIHDLSSYKKSYKLHTSIDKINETQTEDRNGAFSKVTSDDAATVEISKFAKALYASSSETQSQKEKEMNQKLAEIVSNEQTNKNDYAGLSNSEREQKELEDYISNHKPDPSIDVLRNGSLSNRVDVNIVNLMDEEFIKAEKEYTDALSSVADEFCDFSMKITYGDYDSNDVSVNDLNFDAIDNMEQTYQFYKDQIHSTCSSSESDKYLKKLDEVYNSVFNENIIKPISIAYQHKLTFVQPNTKETTRSIKASAATKEGLQNMISSYIACQSIKEKQYDKLSSGTQAFYDMAYDTSTWHNSDKIKNVLTDTMNVYSSVTEVSFDSSTYRSAKSAADAIAKKVSDQYAEQLAYQIDQMGLKNNGIDIPVDDEVQQSINDYITNSSSGMYMIDFSKIPDLNILKGLS
ncbi:MAG: hypothetical protein RR139_00360 [Lachnospiraceae bacterium]